MLPSSTNIVVLYRFSTSNHNSSSYISFLYIKPQQEKIKSALGLSCIISFLYIKPQLPSKWPIRIRVVLYRFSTSNHNQVGLNQSQIQLYYIVSLHQTTTTDVFSQSTWSLYYIVSLHQTTTARGLTGKLTGLYYIVSLHQTTTVPDGLCLLLMLYYIVSLHQTTTK